MAKDFQIYPGVRWRVNVKEKFFLQDIPEIGPQFFKGINAKNDNP